MALAGIDRNECATAISSILQSDDHELDQLAKDLLINVTSFFRDPKVFDALAETVIPDLVRDHTLDQPLRIWIAGCSTGEEAYSLAMLFREQIAAEKRNIKLQVFASDVDPDAIATAREGLYPETIAADVSPERLARFFSKEDHGYKVSADLRATVVFTVQDVLADPPFSRLDLVSCRNLLIYLGPEAQAKVIALFHFALRQGGILLLGSAETRRQPGRPVRGDLQAGAAVPHHRPLPAARLSALRRASPNSGGRHRAPASPRRPRARRRLPICAAGLCWRPTRRQPF